MRKLIPLIVGLFVAGVFFFGMQLFVWELLHGGPELRDRWAGYGFAFLIVPIVVGFLAGWVVHWFMD